MPDATVVFVSHAGSDQQWSAWVAATLEQAGYVVELDVKDWLAGEDFLHRMTEALERADVVVGLWSRAYFKPGGYAILEWRAAMAARKRVCALRIEDVTAPVMWRSVLYNDLFGVSEEEAARCLLANVAATPAWTGDATYPTRTARAWHAPSRSPAFTGREELLTAVRTSLTGQRPPAVAALHGMGGVGKSQTVIEYAHRFADEYDVVWWVDAEQPELIAGQLATLALTCGVTSTGADTPMALTALRAHLRDHSGWLVVFDNARTASDVAEWIPQGAGHVLVTSREHNWSGVAAAIQVELFRRDESVALLRAYGQAMSEHDAEKLAAALGDLPLALSQAAGVMAETSMPAQEYVESLSGAATEVLEEGVPAGYATSLAAAVRLSSARLSTEDPAARRLLDICVVLGPEPIPLRLLTADPASLPPPLDSVAANRFALRRTVGRISRYGLCEVGEATISVHRLTQAILRDQLNPDERELAHSVAESLLVAARPDDGTDPHEWERWQELMPHILATEPESTRREDVQYLACSAVWHLVSRGDQSAAAPLAERLFVSWREADGADHPKVLLAANNLAVIYRDLGRLERARQLDEDTRARRQRVLGPDHEDTLHSTSNLAMDLRELGDHERARILDQETYSRRLRLFGADHPHTLGSALSLAIDLRGLGRFPEALELSERTHAQYEAVHGRDHPYTLAAATHVGIHLRLVGRAEEALRLHEATLARYRTVLGEHHPDTLHCISAAAGDLRALGLVSRALELDQTAHTGYQTHGVERPNALRVMNNLATDLELLGRIEEARVLRTRAWDAFRRLFGDRHPETLQVQHHLEDASP